jgi:hypothetical protein
LRQQQEAARKAAEAERQRVEAEQRRIADDRRAREQRLALLTPIIACHQERVDARKVHDDDLDALKRLLSSSSCQDVQASLSRRVAAIERERAAQEQACAREQDELVQLRKAGASARDRLAELARSLTCKRLHPQVEAALNNVTVCKSGQVVKGGVCITVRRRRDRPVAITPRREPRQVPVVAQPPRPSPQPQSRNQAARPIIMGTGF